MRDESSAKHLDKKEITSKEQIRDFMNSAKTVFLIISPDHKILEFNKEAEKVYGYNRDKVIGKDYLRLVIPIEFHKVVSDDMKEVLAGKHTSGFENIVRSKNGKERTLSWSVSRFSNYENYPYVILAIGQDITDSKKTQDALQASEKRLKDITSVLGQGVYVVDKNNNLAFINPEGERILGWKESDLHGKRVHDIFHYMKPDGTPFPSEQCPVINVLNTGQPYRTDEDYFIRKDKQMFPVSYIATPIKENGEVTGSVNVFQDITERKITEERLRQSEEKHRTLFETMAQGVVYQDASGVIISANPAAERILGLSVEQMQGRTSKDPRWRAIHDDGSDFPGETHPSMEALRTGREIKNVVMGVFHPNEEKYHWININAVPLFKPGDKKPNQVYATFEDITELRQSRELSDALNNINNSINSTVNFDEIMRHAVKVGSIAIGAQTGAITLIEDNFWVVKYLFGSMSPDVIGTKFTNDQARGSAIAAEIKKPVISSDAFNDTRFNHEQMKKYSIRTYMAIPLIVKEKVIGTIAFFHHSTPFAFSDKQVDFAVKLASSVSLSLDNARLYNAERDIADTLQEALLTVPQKINGIDFGYLYRSATETAMVGGDFYDLFELGQHNVGIVIGDVSGKGVEAATLTSLVKNCIKAFAFHEESPASIISKTNVIVNKSTSEETFVTVFFGILNVSNGMLTYCCAGHSRAIIKDDLESFLLKANSPAIGIIDEFEFKNDVITIDKKKTLILYTDGIIEAKRESDLYGEERLVNLIKRMGKKAPKDIPESIFKEILKYTGNKLTDDIAILTVAPKN